MTQANYDALAVPVNLKRNLPTNMPQFIERTHFNLYTKKFIKNIRPSPGLNPLILLLVSFPTSYATEP